MNINLGVDLDTTIVTNKNTETSPYKIQSFKLKGRIFTHKVLELISMDLDLLKTQLEATVASAPKLFASAPIVLDFRHLKDCALDLSSIIKIIQEFGLIPFGVQHVVPEFEPVVASLGLALIKGGTGGKDKEIKFDSAIPAEPTQTEDSHLNITAQAIISEKIIPEKIVMESTKLINLPVRSGQQSVNREGDLIVTSAVSPGAELLASGHIHVYGVLRGRALAGIKGNTSARIFCQALDAELVSIAGIYRLRDSFEPMNFPCQIYLHQERICIEPLNK